MSFNQSLFAYLEELPADVLEQLYSCPWTCLSVLRALPDIAKQILLRVLYQASPVPTKSIENAWMKQQKRTQARSALKSLERLRVVISKVDASNGQRLLSLESNFKRQVSALAVGFGSGNAPWKPEKNVAKETVAVRELDEFAYERWSLLLHFIVGSKEKKQPHSKIVDLLTKMGIMAYPNRTRRPGDIPVITNTGYEFMLIDISEQIWSFMRYYTQEAERQVDVLQMMFQMNYCVPGNPCAVAALTETQQQLLGDFVEFGLIYRKRRGKDSADLFYPTSLGVNIVFGQSKQQQMKAAQESLGQVGQFQRDVRSANGQDISSQDNDGEGPSSSSGMFVILETNFKCYVYTQSSLHVEMLKLFLTIECILPNLVVGLVTRKSINSAFKKGIEAKQIIHFLEQNAHPLCRRRHKLLPDNVTDQIILWERERNRITLNGGVLYHDFESEEQFLAVVSFALDKGIHRWSNKSKHQLFVDAQHHDTVKGFFQQLRDRS